MSQRFISILLTTAAVCYGITERNEYIGTSELAKKGLAEDKLLTSIVRARNSSKVPYLRSNGSEGFDSTLDKQPRTSIRHSESDSRDNSSCCGFRYGSNGSTRTESYYNRSPGDGSRNPSQYGERLPVDRYGWQTQGQPPGPSGNAGRPGGGNYAAASLYEGSQAGDRFGSRPSYGGESSRRPTGYESAPSGGYGYGNGGYGGYGSGKPSGYWGSTASGGYGISGTFANGDEFGPVEPNYPEGNGPPHPNIQAQKAVALKALAGVALLGAAAALATNPVLLPIGIVSGRRKRSNFEDRIEDDHMDYILGKLQNNFNKVYSNGNGSKVSMSPMCIARLACEIQKNYRYNLVKDVKYFKERKELKYRPPNLMSNSVLKAELRDRRIKNLIKAATTLALNGGSCSTFTCTFVKTVEAQNRRSVVKF
ncbi:uncharacterized protein LOC143374869 [Andrena cerasifolii]|uniref:uncharacterized protein LOC143374869 n=1 Tax=Andrena cerasifolii TaxID=2819439 RepID=UPI004037ACE0